MKKIYKVLTVIAITFTVGFCAKAYYNFSNSRVTPVDLAIENSSTKSFDEIQVNLNGNSSTSSSFDESDIAKGEVFSYIFADEKDAKLSIDIKKNEKIICSSEEYTFDFSEDDTVKFKIIDSDVGIKLVLEN